MTTKLLLQLEPKKDGVTRYLKFTWIGTLFNNNFPNVLDSKNTTKEHKIEPIYQTLWCSG